MSAFASTARRLGKARVTVTREETAAFGGVDPDWPLERCSVDELGRVTLLLSVAGLPSHELEALVEACYRSGDTRERQAILRALPLLPYPERYVSIGLEACRSHVQPIFEAIACENPFPASRFPGLHFNQMVLKALGVGVRLERIVGWRSRITPELSRMAKGCLNERQAAGRPVPEDVWLLLSTVTEPA